MRRHAAARAPAIAAAMLLAAPLFLPQAADAPKPVEITVTAKKYEFNPPRLELKVGQTYAITFKSLDAKHGFVSPDAGIEKVVYSKDEPVTITFTPKKAGTFRFKCAKFCGLGHGKMKGEIVVTE